PHRRSRRYRFSDGGFCLASSINRLYAASLRIDAKSAFPTISSAFVNPNSTAFFKASRACFLSPPRAQALAKEKKICGLSGLISEANARLTAASLYFLEERRRFGS